MAYQIPDTLKAVFNFQRACISVLESNRGEWMCPKNMVIPLDVNGILTKVNLSPIILYDIEDAIEQALDDAYDRNIVNRRKLPGCLWEYQMPSLD